MKYLIVYWTRFGNNRKIVDYLASNLGAEVRILRADQADPAKLPESDLYIFSAAAERFSVQSDMKKLMKNLQGMEGKKYAIINTHGLKKKNWLKAMEKLLSKKGMVKVAETDFRIMLNEDRENILEPGWEQKLDSLISKIG